VHSPVVFRLRCGYSYSPTGESMIVGLQGEKSGKYVWELTKEMEQD